jgi:hypothetical protein
MLIDAIPLCWVNDPLNLDIEGVEYLSFTPSGQIICAMHRNPIITTSVMVTCEVFVTIVDEVKVMNTSKYFISNGFRFMCFCFCICLLLVIFM